MAITYGSSVSFSPLPVFTGENYGYWSIKMKTFFVSQGLWNIIQNGATIPHGQHEILDAEAMYYIQQALAPSIFPRIRVAKSAKNAWDILQTEFQIKKDMDYFVIKMPENLETLWPECCIHGIPKDLRDLNEAAYSPRFISIGPLHHGKPELANMEKHKFNYAQRFLNRTPKTLEELVVFVRNREGITRRCYLEHCAFDSSKYVKMILVDALFIFELFIRDLDKLVPEYSGDPLLHKIWLRDGIQLDLLLFENQLPYSLLLELYHFAFNDIPSYQFYDLCRKYFNRYNSQQDDRGNSQQDKEEKSLHFTGRMKRIWSHLSFYTLCIKYVNKYNSQQPQDDKDKSQQDAKEEKILHFTDLMRRLQSKKSPEIKAVGGKTKTLKYAAKSLSEAGVKFIGIENGSLAEISFSKGKFKLPKLEVNNTTERIFRNLMALEQSQYSFDAYFCSYVLLLDFLINSNDDVGVLVEKGVLINKLGSRHAVADMVNNLCINIADTEFHYQGICEDLNRHCESWLNITLATLKGVYFADVWHGTGTLAGFVLLALTILQTIWSITRGGGS